MEFRHGYETRQLIKREEVGILHWFRRRDHDLETKREKIHLLINQIITD